MNIVHQTTPEIAMTPDLIATEQRHPQSLYIVYNSITQQAPTRPPSFPDDVQQMPYKAVVALREQAPLHSPLATPRSANELRLARSAMRTFAQQILHTRTHVNRGMSKSRPPRCSSQKNNARAFFFLNTYVGAEPCPSPLLSETRNKRIDQNESAFAAPRPPPRITLFFSAYCLKPPSCRSSRNKRTVSDRLRPKWTPSQVHAVGKSKPQSSLRHGSILRLLRQPSLPAPPNSLLWSCVGARFNQPPITPNPSKNTFPPESPQLFLWLTPTRTQRLLSRNTERDVRRTLRACREILTGVRHAAPHSPVQARTDRPSCF